MHDDPRDRLPGPEYIVRCPTLVDWRIVYDGLRGQPWRKQPMHARVPWSRHRTATALMQSLHAHGIRLTDAEAFSISALPWHDPREGSLDEELGREIALKTLEGIQCVGPHLAKAYVTDAEVALVRVGYAVGFDAGCCFGK